MIKLWWTVCSVWYNLFMLQLCSTNSWHLTRKVLYSSHMKINCMVMICRKITEDFQLSVQGGVCGAACRTVCRWRQVDTLFLDRWKDSCWCFCCYLLLSPVCLLLLTWSISSCMFHHRVHRTDAPLWSVCATIVEHLHNRDFDSCSVNPYLACVCVMRINQWLWVLFHSNG